MSGWSEGLGYPDVIFGIPVNFVRLQRDFGQREPSAHGGTDSIRGPPENRKGGRAPPRPPLATSMHTVRFADSGKKQNWSIKVFISNISNWPDIHSKNLGEILLFF